MSATVAAPGNSEAPGNRYALAVDGVGFKRGSRCFGPLTLHVRSGEMVGLLGPNGAGKTSLLQVIQATLKPLSGMLLINGRDITKLGRSGRRNAGVFICLHDHRRVMPNRSMLEIVAEAVSRAPQVLVLDEPFRGLNDWLPKQSMIAVLKACRTAGTAVLLTEQNVRAAFEIVDRAYLMHRGKIMFEGTPDELMRQRPD